LQRALGQKNQAAMEEHWPTRLLQVRDIVSM